MDLKSLCEMKNSSSHFTAKEREKASFPLNVLLKADKIVGRVLDFGSGFGKDTEKLKSLGFDAIAYDPYYSPIEVEGKFDTIICIYVLNVLQPHAQSEVIMEISHLLKPDGVAYFAVRRDLKREGFRKHAKHDVYTFQANVQLKMESVYKNDFTEIYKFQKFNLREKTQLDQCVFCSLETETIAENNNSFAIFDKYPVNEGHVLVIPKRHVANYFELNFTEQLSLWNLTNFVRTILEKRYQPDGFNVGINVNEAGGQTVHHVHVHLIPRYDGDVDNPTGGVRGVIPSKKDY
jgi:ATP adenylyltransferase